MIKQLKNIFIKKINVVIEYRGNICYTFISENR